VLIHKEINSVPFEFHMCDGESKILVESYEILRVYKLSLHFHHPDSLASFVMLIWLREAPVETSP
jgi:hypothetical protein